MKQLKLTWCISDKDLQEWVDKQIATTVNPYLPVIIKNFYEMLWGSQTLRVDGECIQDYPEIHLQIEFNKGYPIKGSTRAKVFWLNLISWSSDSFSVELTEYEHEENRIAYSEEKFKDWI